MRQKRAAGVESIRGCERPDILTEEKDEMWMALARLLRATSERRSPWWASRVCFWPDFLALRRLTAPGAHLFEPGPAAAGDVARGVNENIRCDRIVHAAVEGTHAYAVLSAITLLHAQGRARQPGRNPHLHVREAGRRVEDRVAGLGSA